jgi:hypothetical protein
VPYCCEVHWIMHRTSLKMILPFKVSNSSCPSSTIRQGREEASNQGMYKRRTSDGTASTEDSYYDSSVSSTESSAAASSSSPSLIHRQRAKPNHRCQLMNDSLTGILKPSFVSESITKRQTDRYNIRVATFNFIHNLKLKGDGEETTESCFSKLQSVTKKSVVSFCPTMEVYAYVQEGVSWTRE